MNDGLNTGKNHNGEPYRPIGALTPRLSECALEPGHPQGAEIFAISFWTTGHMATAGHTAGIAAIASFLTYVAHELAWSGSFSRNRVAECGLAVAKRIVGLSTQIIAGNDVNGRQIARARGWLKSGRPGRQERPAARMAA
jgi:uncharacterized membrane protein